MTTVTIHDLGTVVEARTAEPGGIGRLVAVAEETDTGWYVRDGRGAIIHPTTRIMAVADLRRHVGLDEPAPYPLPEAAGPGADGAPDGPAQFGGWSPAGAVGPPVPCPGCGGTADQHETIPCPGCRGEATLHGDGGHMSPEEAALARRVKELTGRLTAGQITPCQAVEEMRGWTA